MPRSSLPFKPPLSSFLTLSFHRIEFHRSKAILCSDPIHRLHSPWLLPTISLSPASTDNRPTAENDELDHAVALSLAEGVKKPNGYKRPAENDEDLARALQESLNMSSCPPFPPTQIFSRGCRICGGCNREIGYGHYLSCMGTFWHPQCFCCHGCSQPITEHEFSLSGTNPFHKSCYKELHHPKCDVCRQFIPTNTAGLIEYRAHPFWNQKYCPSHDHDRTPRCCSCERMESRKTRYMSLGDGRSLCLECLDSAILDTGDCQPLYHAIRDYYEGMNMRLDQQIPMLLVERQALNEAMEGEKDGHHHMPETRGLCLSEEQTVSSIRRKPRIGGNFISDLKTQKQKLTRKSEVTAILVLFGLPRLLTGSILAHELMHGWLRLNGYRNLNPEVEEGICQVLSHMWLESEVMPASRSMPSTSMAASSSSSHAPSSSKKAGKSDIEKKLGEFFMHQIVHDSSPAYGGGFRAANAAVNRYGLRRTLDHIRLTGDFPG
ncbi:LIM domain-containing protein HDR3 isoform X1 [Magnolia sinica]|uniref:LIM domain-containing protein HDR3 isoform X1 n=1 Tax=Magnolia sinica TaxID=86752 RepID=UPI00265A00D7|nr:LIM domain-containing protein HDR3 isoform X1 [Magnolia sinica]